MQSTHTLALGFQQHLFLSFPSLLLFCISPCHNTRLKNRVDSSNFAAFAVNPRHSNRLFAVCNTVSILPSLSIFRVDLLFAHRVYTVSVVLSICLSVWLSAVGYLNISHVSSVSVVQYCFTGVFPTFSFLFLLLFLQWLNVI